MKKKNIVNLIKYYAENNDVSFRNEAQEIAIDFDRSGDFQLAEYITSLLSNVNTLIPQMENFESSFFEKIGNSVGTLLFSDEITKDLLGVINAVGHQVGVNKFLFQGAPGTGKTEAVKHIANILERDLFMVDFSNVIDSKLGQTQKNISEMFKEINNFGNPNKVLILMDEIDSIALDRTNQNDLREMGRATSAILKGLDRLDSRVVLIATTNLYEHFDKALVRRFDSVVNFNRYSKSDLLEISEKMLDQYLTKFKLANRDVRIFRKIMSLADPVPYPGDLKNLIKTSVAFSDPTDGLDYFRRLYYGVCGHAPENVKLLQDQKFTVREIEILTKKSKSSISRLLKEEF